MFFNPTNCLCQKAGNDKAGLDFHRPRIFGFCQNDGDAGCLPNLDDSAIVLNPGIANAKAYYGTMPKPGPLLQWEPALSEVSFSDDFGYTLGSWTMCMTDTTPPAIFGHYLTIWRKSSAGKWLAIFDSGINNPKPDSGTTYLPELRVEKIAKNQVPSRKNDDDNRSLRIADNVFATIAGKQGVVSAFKQTGADDIRLLRQQNFPITGIDAAQAWLSTKPDHETWKQVRCDVASSGELGYTIGEVTVAAHDNQKERHGYHMRVWRLDPNQVWKVVIDLTLYAKEKK